MASLPNARSDADRKVLADVAEHGWHGVWIPEEAGTPGWTFSVGLSHTYGHAEIVVFGLPSPTAHAMIANAVVDIEAGKSFMPSSSSDAILEGYTCSFRSVHRNWHAPLLGLALWFYGEPQVEALQCLWPDRDGHLPDSESCSSSVRARQPMLEHQDASTARLEAVLATLHE